MIPTTFEKAIASAATPERLSTSNLHCRSFMLEASYDNTGDMFLATSEAQASSTERHLLAPGERINFSADNWGDLDAHYNLKYFWLKANTDGDSVVVTYITHNIEYELKEI